MTEITKAIIFGSITFIVLFLLYYNLFLKRKWQEYSGKKKSKSKTKPLDFMEFSYLKERFKLDMEKVDVLYCLKIIGILDSFIISTTGTIIYYIPGPLLWKYTLGFAILFALIYALYEVFGRHLIKKGWSKNEL